jgi:uncharacterized RDD family membrane protein YckC
MNDDPMNPYAAPKAEIQPISHDEDLQDASGTKRFLNFIIDRIVGMAFAFLVFLLIGLLEQAGLISGFVDWTEKMSGLMDIILTTSLITVYYVIMESTCGRTIGKLVTGTKVIDLKGGHPDFLTIIGRTLSRIVPFEPFSFLGGNNRGWHDTWSDTRVIDLRKPPIPKPRPMSEMRMPRMYRPPGANQSKN